MVQKFSMLCILRKAFLFCGMKNSGQGVWYINHTPHILYCKIGLVYVTKFSNDKFGVSFGRYKISSSYKEFISSTMEGIITKSPLKTDQYFGDLQSLLSRRAPAVCAICFFVLAKWHQTRLAMADIPLHKSFGSH